MDEEQYIIKTEPLHDGKSLRGIGWYCFEKMLLHKDKISQVRISFLHFYQKSTQFFLGLRKNGTTRYLRSNVKTFNSNRDQDDEKINRIIRHNIALHI